MGTALAQFNKVIRDEPNHAEGYYGRAFANWKIGKLDLAIADMSKAIELNPTEATAYRSRGGFYVLKHDCNRVISEALAHRRQNGFDLVDPDCDRAIADCDEAIRLNLKDASTYNNRGYAYLVKGNAQKAIADFTEAIRIDPKFGIAYANRGFAWSQQHDYDRESLIWTNLFASRRPRGRFHLVAWSTISWASWIRPWRTLTK